VGAFSAVLILFSAGVYFFVSRTLRERLDTRLLSTLQIAGAAIAHYGTGSLLGSEVLENPRFPGQVVALLDLEGRVLAKRPMNSALPLRLPSFPGRGSEFPQFYQLEETKPDTDDSCRGVYQRVSDASRNPYMLVVAESSESLSDQLDALQNGLMIAVVLALLLAGTGGWLLAGKSLAPVAVMAAAIERISAQNLEERLPVRNSRDELGRLASTFNSLLSRLSAAFSQQRQFMADASHELRTPLSVIRTAAQVTLQKPQRPETEYRDAVAMIEQQAGRLAHLVEDMLELTRADMNQLQLQIGALYLDEIIADTTRAFGVLAERKGVHLKSQAGAEAPCRGDERLLRQMISNLLDNAIKFTPEGGTVGVQLQQAGSSYQITVTDTGCGIPEELQPRVFERFFRADKARGSTQGPGGAGLGLAIARSIAELHRGRLTLQRSGPEGTTFCVSLPFRD
jgi:heavy metal sensor kinase